MRQYSIIFLVVLGIGFATMAVGLVSMGQSVATARKTAAAASTRINTVVPKVPGAEVTMLPSIAGKAILGVCVLFWAFGFFHAALNSSLHGHDKKSWIMITAFVPTLGSVIYFFLAPRPYTREHHHRRHHHHHERGS